jgi:hypothetical protein
MLQELQQEMLRSSHQDGLNGRPRRSLCQSRRACILQLRKSDIQGHSPSHKLAQHVLQGRRSSLNCVLSTLGDRTFFPSPVLHLRITVLSTAPSPFAAYKGPHTMGLPFWCLIVLLASIYPLDANSNIPPSPCTHTTVFKHCQMSPRRQNCPPSRISFKLLALQRGAWGHCTQFLPF